VGINERSEIRRPLCQRRLGAALAATDGITDAPLRLEAHYVEIGREVFELHEEFEDGTAGRMLRVAVHRRSLEIVGVQQFSARPRG
jgi:hypothetical protein